MELDEVILTNGITLGANEVQHGQLTSMKDVLLPAVSPVTVFPRHFKLEQYRRTNTSAPSSKSLQLNFGQMKPLELILTQMNN